MSRNKIFTSGVICVIILSLSVEVYPEEKAKKAAAPKLGAKESIGRTAKIAEKVIRHLPAGSPLGVRLSALASRRSRGKPREAEGRQEGDFLEEVKPFQYDPKGKRDPFTPLVNREGLFFEPAVRKENIVSDTAADNALSLEGIVYEEGGSSCAVINSEIVQSGDKIGDYQVLEVQKQKVILGKAEEILELELKKEDE